MPHAASSLSPPPPLRGPPPPLAQGRLFSYGMSASLPDTQDLAAAKSRRSVKGYGILASPIAMGEVASAASRWGRSCRTRLCGWCSIASYANGLAQEVCFNAARGFVSGAAHQSKAKRCSFCGVSMPHAALWVVQLSGSIGMFDEASSFNAARGFVGGAALEGVDVSDEPFVSMPHAALWVVQPRNEHHYGRSC